MAKPWLIERGPLLVSLAAFTAELNFGFGLVSYGKQYTAFTCVYLSFVWYVSVNVK